MSLCELLQQDLKEARLARADSVKIDVLKMVVNRFQVEAKNELRDPTDEDAIKAINYYTKGAYETVDQMFARSMTEDPRYAVAVQEVAILRSYLPKRLEGEELLAVIRSIGATDIGTVMKALRAQYGTAFDAKGAKDMFLAEVAKKD